MIRHFTKLVYRLTLLLIILGGILVGLAHILTPLAESYRKDVELLATEALGQPVTIGYLDAQWRGLGPQLVLHNINFIHPDTKEPSLQLAEIIIEIGLIDSLRNAAITPRRITLAKPDLQIKRYPDGRISIEGLEGLAPLSITDQAQGIGGLFRLPKHIAVTDGQIVWEDQAIGAAPMRFGKVNLELHNDGNRHQLNGSLIPPGAIDSKLTLSADIIGDLQQPDGWAGQFYLSGDNLILSRLLQQRIPDGYALAGGRAHAELWGDWQQGRVRQLEGDILLEDLRIQQRQTDGKRRGEWKAEALGGQFQWLRREGGWRLEIADLLLRTPNGRWPRSHLAIELDLNEQGEPLLRVGADLLRIQDLLGVVPLLPRPDPQMEQALKALHPAGDLHDLRLELTDSATGVQWRLSTGIEALKTHPWRKLPGVENLRARIEATRTAGFIDIDTRNALIDTAGMFRAPLRLERLRGRLDWQALTDGGWRIDSQRLVAENSDVRTRSRLHLHIPATPEESAFIDLQTDFRDGNAVNAARYYPTSIMPEEVVAWLDRAIGKGRVTSGSALVRGPIRDFPFDKGQTGRFEILFNVEDLQLDYQKGWPVLSDISAEVRFLNNRLDIWASDGTIYDSRIEQAHGAIDNLRHATRFQIAGRVAGPLQDNLRLLRESPLSKKFGPMLQGIQADGPARLTLDFTIPLGAGARERLSGTLEFLNSSLNLHEWALPLTDITGRLRFDLSQIQGRGIKGKLQGHGIRVDVGAVPNNPDATRLNVTATLPMASIKQRFKAVNLQPLKGQGNWQLRIDIPHISTKRNTLPIRISSDLRGIAIDLPAPLGKDAKERRKLLIVTRLGASAQTPLQFGYGKLLSASLLMDTRKPEAPRLLRGEIRLGSQRARLPSAKGLRIVGGWQHFELEPWLKLWEQSEGIDAAPALAVVDLGFNKLILDNMALNQARITLHNRNGNWQGEVASDRFNGTLSIPHDLERRPVRIDLDRFDLHLDPDQWSNGKTTEDPTSEPEADPTKLPGIIANIGRLRLNDKDYGSLTLRSRKLAGGLQIDQLRINAKQMQFSANGRWIKRKGGQQHTSLNITLNSDSFGNLLSDLGFQANLEEAPAEIEAQLDWAGNPLEFSRDRLNGHLNMQVDSGRFLDVNPGVGRVFGLFNLGALQRRLTLDFSDLVKKGLAFDSIEGSFLLEAGDAYTNNFKMIGPAASIEIAGRIGLGAEDFDQLVTVIPQISSNFTLAGTFAGGPAVGAALFLAQKLIGDKFDKATQTQYIVTGPWSDPNIRKKQVERDEEVPIDQLSPDLLGPSAKDQDANWELPAPNGRPHFYRPQDEPPRRQ